VNFKQEIVRANAGGTARKPRTAFGNVEADLLENLLPGFLSPELYEMIGGMLLRTRTGPYDSTRRRVAPLLNSEIRVPLADRRNSTENLLPQFLIFSANPDTIPLRRGVTVARQAHNLEAVGSIPAGAISIRSSRAKR
jgi:hypothetical protein